MSPGPPCQETGLKVHPWGLWEKHSIALKKKKKRLFWGLVPATIWAEWPDLTKSCASSSVFLQLSFTVLNWSGRRKLLLMVCRLQTLSPVQKLKGMVLAKTRVWEELRALHWISELGHYLHPHVWEVRALSQLWNLYLQPLDWFFLRGLSVRDLSVLDTPQCWGSCLVYHLFSTWFTGTKHNSHLPELEMSGWLNSFDKPEKWDEFANHMTLRVNVLNILKKNNKEGKANVL